MSWERSESELVFFCDAPGCNSSKVYLIAAGTDVTQHFMAASRDLRETQNWSCTKIVGRHWRHWCSLCPEAANYERQEYELRERDREKRARE